LYRSKRTQRQWQAGSSQVTAFELDQSRASSIPRTTARSLASTSAVGEQPQFSDSSRPTHTLCVQESGDRDSLLGENDDDMYYHHARMQETFDFCVSDFRPEIFWFEPVDMLRKLALSGLLQFVERGTALQVLVGCSIAFVSFGLQLRLRPYREPEANAMKALVEVQIFLAFLISFILRALPSIETYEPFSASFYGWVLMLSLLFTLISAVALTYSLSIRRRHFRKQLTSDFTDEFRNGKFELTVRAGQGGMEGVRAQMCSSMPDINPVPVGQHTQAATGFTISDTTSPFSGNINN
jgi:hypothetical protein